MVLLLAGSLTHLSGVADNEGSGEVKLLRKMPGISWDPESGSLFVKGF